MGPPHPYFACISKTLIEYGGNVRVKFALSPSTFVVTGTIRVGSVIEFVSLGPVPLIVMACPPGSTAVTPLNARCTDCGVPARFTTFT